MIIMAPKGTAEGMQRLRDEARSRRDELGLTQQDVVEATGSNISIDTVRNIELARAPVGIRGKTKRDLERGYQWRRGSIDLIFEGEDPLPLEDVQEPVESDRGEASEALRSDYEDACAMLREARRILGPHFMDEVLRVRREAEPSTGTTA